jgi:hypothetical protein
MSTQAKAARATVRRKRVATGPKRPRYLVDRDLDRMMIMLVALMGEVSSLRDRIDTHEALADAGKTNKTDEVEQYAITKERHSRREEIRMAMVRRVFRVLMEELESGKSTSSFDLNAI